MLYSQLAELLQTLDKQTPRQYLRTDSIFSESQLKYDVFPDRLAKKNIIFQA